MGPRGLGPKTRKLLKSLKIMRISVFFQHGKDAHHDSATVALNDSSRSLIWNILKQLVFLKICENVKSIKIGAILGPIAVSRRKVIAASRRQIIAVSRRK